MVSCKGPMPRRDPGAGGITIRDGAILLVRYRDPSGDSYLVCPGGASLDEEGIGEVARMEGAREEGIVEAGWFRMEQLRDEIVFPPPVMVYDWDSFAREDWRVHCLPMRKLDL